MTKQERCEQDTLWSEIFSSTKSLGTNAMSFLLKSVKSRQVGSNEAVDRLLGHKLYSKSRQTRFADLQHPDLVKRILKPCKDIEELLKNDPESTDISINTGCLTFILTDQIKRRIPVCMTCLLGTRRPMLKMRK